MIINRYAADTLRTAPGAAAIVAPKPPAATDTVTISLEYKGSRMVIPLNPENLKLSRASPGYKSEVIGIGEVSLPTEPKLAVMDVVSFFWGQQLAAGHHAYRTAKEYADWLELWQEMKTPARFVVESGAFSMFKPMWVTCEHFHSDVRAGEEADIYYELRLQEYRPHGARTAEHEGPPPPPARVNPKPPTEPEVKVPSSGSLTATVESVKRPYHGTGNQLAAQIAMIH